MNLRTLGAAPLVATNLLFPVHAHAFDGEGALYDAAKKEKAFTRYGAYVAPPAAPVVVTYNTSVVTAAAPPKKWTDLADPKWKGKVRGIPEVEEQFRDTVGI